MPKWWTVPQLSSVLQDLGGSVGNQSGDLILLQLENHLRVAVRFAQTQKRLDAIVAGNTETEPQVQGFAVTLQNNAAGGRTLTAHKVGSVTSRQATGGTDAIMPHHVATLGGGVVDDHAHPVVSVDQFRDQPSGEGLRSDGVQGIAAHFVKEVSGFLYDGDTLIGAPLAGIAHEGAEVIKAGRVQKGIGLGSVDPIERPILQTRLMLDADGGVSSHGVRFVTGAAQVGHSLREHLTGVQKGDGVMLIGDTRVMNGTVGLESHLGSGERHPSELS